MDYDINFDDLANKLFCTFTAEEQLDSTLATIKEQYDILFNKIFGILQDLDFTISRALGNLFGFWHGQDARINAYKELELTNAQVNDIVIRACRAGALPKSKIIDVVDQWESSDHPEFWDRNVNSLYNAFTEIYKGNLVALPNRSDALHSVLDSVVDFDIDNHVPNVVDVEVIENELVSV